MSWFNFFRKRTPESRGEIPLRELRGAGRPFFSPVSLSETTALKVTAVWSAISVLHRTLQTLPLQLWQEDAQGVPRKVKTHPLSTLLTLSPTDYLTAASWSGVRMAHQALWGNSFTEVVREAGEIVELLPHHPSCVQMQYTPYERFRRRYYVSSLERGGYAVEMDSIVHSMSLSLDGLSGISPLRHHGGTLGVASSATDLVYTCLNNDPKMNVVFSAPGTLGQQQHERLAKQIQAFAAANGGSYNPYILEGGTKLDSLSMNLQELQIIELLNLTGEDIVSRIFGVPPHLCGYLKDAHYANFEEGVKSFRQFTINPWCVADAQELTRKLLTPKEISQGLYLMYNTDAILRGTTSERYAAHSQAVMGGWKTINEVRLQEELPPLPGGDELRPPQAVFGKPPQE